MMNITGPIIPNQPTRVEDNQLSLRINQRVVAEVMRISGDAVTLSMQGVQVVARLTSDEQVARLTERRMAQFIVREIKPDFVLMQLASEAQIIPNWSDGQTGDLVANLLKQTGLEPTPENIDIMRAMLSMGMKADISTLARLKTVLDTLGEWGEKEAHYAAALKNNALPISPGALELIMKGAGDLHNLFGDLTARLESLLRQNPPQRLAESVQQALSVLRSLVLDWNAAPEKLAEQIRQMAAVLGRSLEKDLAEMLQGKTSQTTPGLLVLARLRQNLVNIGDQTSVRELDQLLDGLRYIHLLNAENGDPAAGQWARMEIPLRLAHPQAGGYIDYTDARLKIAYHHEEDSERKIDPRFTQLVIQVDLTETETIEVALSIVGRQVGAQVTAVTPEVVALATEEIPALKNGLENLGFELQTSRCQAGKGSHAFNVVPQRLKRDVLKEVNLEA